MSKKFTPAPWPRKLRSQHWYGGNSRDTIYHRGWLKNQGYPHDLFDGRPVIGIMNTWADLTPCNGHLRELAEKVKAGVWEAGGFPVEVPVFSASENTYRPTAMMYRNLAAMAVEEAMRGQPIDGAVLMVGCDKTTPSLLMGAASTDIPSIVVTGGPMLNGWFRGERIGSGTHLWKFSEAVKAGEMTQDEFLEAEQSMSRSSGTCNTMGTASTMASMAEALGMALSGNAAIPAVDSRRRVMAQMTGRRIVQMVKDDLKPSDILTRESFENAIVVNAAIGGSTNAPPHLQAIARHAGIALNVKDWETIGFEVPLLLNMQPAGEFLGESFFRAGGVPAVMGELMKAGLIREGAMTVSGRTMGENLKGWDSRDGAVIRAVSDPLRENAGFLVLSGNLFDSALMKTSVISPDFRDRFLSRPGAEGIHEARAIVFEGPEDYHDRINDPALGIDENCILFIRNVGCVGYPGSAEVVNMQPPDALLKAGINHLPTVGDGRQSGTSESPSILNASPEAVVGGGLAYLRTGDRVRLDLNARRMDALVDAAEWQARKDAWQPPELINQTPWQELYRRNVGQLADGGCLELATAYQRVARMLPRDNH